MSTSPPASSRGALIAAVAGCLVLVVALAVMALQTRALQHRLDQAQAAQTPNGTTGNRSSKEALLRKLLADREAAYAKLQSDYTRLTATESRSSATEAAAPQTGRDGSSTNRVSWLERLQTEDPERYKQIQEERERRREYVESIFKDQMTRLDQRLQTAQTQDEANLITQISQTVVKLNDLRQQWQQMGELSEEDRRAQTEQLGAQFREAYQALTTLRATDRQMQLQQLAAQAGYQDPQAAKQFTDAIQRIYKETGTSMDRMMGFGHGGGRGRGGPPEQ